MAFPAQPDRTAPLRPRTKPGFHGVSLLALGLLLLAGSASAHPSQQKDTRQELSGLWVLPADQYMQPANVPRTPAAQAAAEAMHKAIESGAVLSDAGKKCLPIGMPGLMSNEFAFQIMESPGLVAILSENSSLPRMIHFDETTAPDDLMPMWNGHSIGHWEKNVLVIETDDFNDRVSRTPGGGLPSTKLHITEHMQLLDKGETLQDVMSFVDPINLTKPYSVTYRYQRLPAGSELWEYPCEIDAAGWKDRFKGETEAK